MLDPILKGLLFHISFLCTYKKRSMDWIFWLTPVLTGLLGLFITWLALKIFMLNVLPARLPAIAAAAGKMASEFISVPAITEKLTSDESMEKIMPEAEVHVDLFLRTKLKSAFPVVGAFIGDKTINQLKEIFMKELRLILPELLKKYMSNLQQEFDLGETVKNKILAYPPSQMEKLASRSMGGFGYPLLTGFIVGLLCGFCQIGLIYLFIDWLDPLVPGA